MLQWKVPPQKITGVVDEETQFTDLATDIRQMDNLYSVLSVKANHLRKQMQSIQKTQGGAVRFCLSHRKFAGMPTTI